MVIYLYKDLGNHLYQDLGNHPPLILMFSIAIYSIVWGKNKNFIRTEHFSTIHDKKDGCYFGYTFAFI